MASVSKNVYIDEFDELINKYNNIYYHEVCIAQLK